MPPSLGPVKISHKKDGHQRQSHRVHVSRPPSLPGHWIRYCDRAVRLSLFEQNEALIALEIPSLLSLSVADPGFPRGGANPPGRTPTYDFVRYPPKIT